MEKRGHDLTLDLFPIRVPCRPEKDWYVDLFAEVQKRLQIDPRYTLQGGGAYSPAPWAGVTEVVGGLRIVGIKKTSYGAFIQVDYALFGPDQKPLAWCMSLDPVHPAPVFVLEFRDASNQFLVLDAELEARVKALKAEGKGAKGAKAAKGAAMAEAAAPPFSAELPLRAVAATESVVAGADAQSNLYLWDAATGALKARVKSGARGLKSIHQLAFSPKGTYLAVGAGTFAVYEAATGKLVLKLAGHPKGEIWGIQYSPDGRHIATASRGPKGEDNSVALWDASTGDLVKKWPYAQPGRSCTWVAFSADSASLVFAVEHPPSLHRIDVATRQVVAHVALAAEGAPWTVAVESLARTARGWALVVERELLICDPLTLEPVTRAPIDAARPILAALPGNKLLAGRNWVSVYDAETLKVERALPETPDCQGIATDGTRLFAACGTRVHVVTL